jgi:hypothetical protein
LPLNLLLPEIAQKYVSRIEVTSYFFLRFGIKGNYSFVNRTIQVWNQLPVDVLGTLSCKPSNFRKRVRKVLKKEKLKGVREISEVK